MTALIFTLIAGDNDLIPVGSVEGIIAGFMAGFHVWLQVWIS